MRRLLVAIVAAVLVLAGGLALAIPPAAAHALLDSSDPPGGAELDAAPSEVVISFTEPPELSLSSVEVLDASGNSYEAAEPATRQGDDRTLVVPVTDLPDGAYTVNWRVVSRVDGHTTAGAFSFGVGVPAAAGEEAVEVETPALSVLETVGRFTLFSGLVGLIGGATVVSFAFRALGTRHRWLMGVSWVVAVCGLLLLAVAQERAAGSGFSALFDTSIGRALAWRAVAVGGAGLGLALAFVFSGARQKAGMALAGLGAAGAVAAHVAAGHAAATPTPGLDVASQWVHVVAIGVWIGGLATLLLGLPTLLRGERRVAARRFSMLAGVALAAVVATGTLRAVSELPDWDSLVSSGYGRGVLAKVIGVAVLAGLGAANRYRNVPAASDAPAGLLRLGRLELGVAVVVLVAAAIVASLSPPSPTAAAEEPERVVVSGSDAATSVRAELTIDPGIPGTNEFVLQLADFDSDEAIEGADVELRFAFLDDAGVGESELAVDEASPGVYHGSGANLSLEGLWRVTAVVQRGAASVEVPLELEIAAAAPDVRTIDTPGATYYEVDLADGDGTAQIFLEPEEPGPSRVHVFYFDVEGAPLEVNNDAVMARSPEDTEATELPYQPLPPGHGIGQVALSPGDWEFELRAEGPDGSPVSARIPVTIDG